MEVARGAEHKKVFTPRQIKEMQCQLDKALQKCRVICMHAGSLGVNDDLLNVGGTSPGVFVRVVLGSFRHGAAYIAALPKRILSISQSIEQDHGLALPCLDN